MRIGLTGGIASGKSTSAQWWRAQGIHVVDTDALSHQLTGPGGAALPALLAEFGPQLVDPVQGLQRAAMRARVLADPTIKQALEAILHPMIGAAVEQQSHESWVVFDVPLLAEGTRWRPRVDRVLVIDCDESIQIQRGAARPGWSAEQVQQVIQLQASRHKRRAMADAWIDNSLDDLQNLHRNLAELAHHWGWDVKESRA